MLSRRAFVASGAGGLLAVPRAGGAQSAELVAAKVEVIVTAGTPAAVAVKRAAPAIPSALASSRASPGPVGTRRGWCRSRPIWKGNDWSC
jgi:hypothetical protein